MHCLHLMPMDSSINTDLIVQLNLHFDPAEHLFVLKQMHPKAVNIPNCIAAPEYFTIEYINQHYTEYNAIFLHSLYLSQNELLALHKDAASRMIWCVWGHDLYHVRRKEKMAFSDHVHNTVHFLKKVGRCTHLREYRKRQQAARVVSRFRCVLIGYPYDRVMLRKRYGNHVPIEIAPYFSDFDKDDMQQLYQQQCTEHHKGVNILIGHCGFHFIEHETYLRRLSRYRDQDIHIHLVLSYGASEEESRRIRNTAFQLFREDQITIIDTMMTKQDYHAFLSTMDIAIFPYEHQSGVFNTVLLSYLGKKLYFAPNGVLFRGFREMGLPVFDCTTIGQKPFPQFIQAPEPTDHACSLFDIYHNARNIQRWNEVLHKYAHHDGRK